MLNSACRRSERPDSQSGRNRHIGGMKSPKKKPVGAKLRSWRVSILRSRAHNLGTIEAPDAKAAEDFAVKTFGLPRSSAGACRYGSGTECPSPCGQRGSGL